MVATSTVSASAITMFEQFVEDNHLTIWLFELFDFFVSLFLLFIGRLFQGDRLMTEP